MKRKITPNSNFQSSKFIQTASHDVSKSQLLLDTNPEMSLLSKMKMKFILKFLRPPTFKPSGVNQQWQTEQANQNQNNSQENQVENQFAELPLIYPIVGVLQVIQGLLLVTILWITSVSLVYYVKIFTPFFIAVTGIYILKTLGKIAFIWKIEGPQKISSYIITQILVIVQGTAMIIFHQTNMEIGNIVVYGISLIFIFAVWRNLSSYFQITILFAQQNNYRKELRIIQLFAFIVYIAHLLALIMFLVTYIQTAQNTNWLKFAGLQQASWHKKYFYSFYFAVTTMVTVGYGDLAPHNQVQVIIITIIELMGTALFGYMINVIGITVDQIQKKNEEYQNLISTVDKLKSYYQLSRQLCNQMKSDIKRKQKIEKLIPLKPKQELQFLDYIQPNLKQKFVLQTNIKVIKKSIFFLTHFTTNFQNQIALKLNRIIYKAEEEVKIFNGDQISLAIIDSGKLNIQVQKHYNLTEFRKNVKFLQPIEGKPTLNVFGYSSLILNKKSRLRAFVEETAVIYSLKRTQVLDCMNRNMLDFQSFSQLREKMLQYRIFQEIQAPSLKDFEKHYVPNTFILQKKIICFSQPRQRRKRRTNKMKVKIATIANYKFKTILMIDSQQNLYRKGFSQVDIPSISDISQQIKNQCLTIKSDKIMIDSHKNFDNFMKNSNLDKVSQRYSKACQRKIYKLKSRRETMRLKKNFQVI